MVEEKNIGYMVLRKTEDELKNYCLENMQAWNIAFVPGDMNCLIAYLKKDKVLSGLLAKISAENAYKLSERVLRVFKIRYTKTVRALLAPWTEREDFPVYVRSMTTYWTVRCCDWSQGAAVVVSETAGKVIIKEARALYCQRNKWGDEMKPYQNTIVYNEQGIVWIETEMPGTSLRWYLLEQNGIYYALNYEHRHYGGEKELMLYHGLIDQFASIPGEYIQNRNFDQVINHLAFYPFLGEYQKINVQSEKDNVATLFPKRFFWRGPLWTPQWKGPISGISGLKFKDNLLCVQIENHTYPKKACALLDLKVGKIVKVIVKNTVER
jgi:hypothetical protein